MLTCLDIDVQSKKTTTVSIFRFTLQFCKTILAFANYIRLIFIQSDLFDRLSKTDTFASKDMKGQVDRSPKRAETDKRTTVSINPSMIYEPFFPCSSTNCNFIKILGYIF